MRQKSGTEFVPAKPHALLTTGEVIRMLRELKRWTQAEPAPRCGISSTNICLLENGRVAVGKKRPELMAKASASIPLSSCFPSTKEPK